MTDENLDDRTATDATADRPAAESTAEPETPHSTTDNPPQYGVGPFSLREVILGGVWLVAFVVSFFPVNLVVGPAAALIGGANVWVSGLSWILAIGVPTVAVFLLILRRLSPQGITRVGSLGIDQFASVAFSVAFVVWLQSVWETVAISIETGAWVRSWVIWVELVLMLAGVVLTVLAPFLPALEQDFQDRREVPAHRNARPIRPVVARPKTDRPARTEPTPVGAQEGGGSAAPSYDTAPSYDAAPSNDSGVVYDPATSVASAAANDTGAQDTASHATDVFASLHESEPQTTTDEWAPVTDDTAQTTQIPAQTQQAFWALAPAERDVVDDYGSPLFRIGPTAWALVIEDRGEAFVVRHEDGRVGFLHDLTGVTRG